MRNVAGLPQVRPMGEISVVAGESLVIRLPQVRPMGEISAVAGESLVIREAD
ncbi:hypothetical protein J6590_009660 [Homalodisca vitripennis]|nr:hypothetical protein J6590_009660 [Homalodisca vitripennis]